MKIVVTSHKAYKRKFPKVRRAAPVVHNANPRYRDPVHFQIKNPRWLVCQGWITTENGREHHCWLEFSGLVVDLFYNMRMSVTDYYRLHRATHVHKFTKAESRNLMDSERKYGPWVIEEDV